MLNINLNVNKHVAAEVSRPVKLQVSKRDNLSKVLFGCKSNNNKISFGWSKKLPEVEKEILDLLTSPAVKTVLVASHSRPDGDAYGSNIGVCGILESLNKDVHSIIDYKPANNFAQMPSAVKNKTATQYVTTYPDRIKPDRFDVAVITDTADPKLTTDAVVDLMAKADKIVIIDHHPDYFDKWMEALSKRGVSKDKILYWREDRTSAAEMIGELDKEIVKESKSRKIAQYDPNYYHNYRLAIAGGILTDCGGLKTNTGNPDEVVISRLSKQKVKEPSGKFESVTRSIFNWLVKNSGLKQRDINFQNITRCSYPAEVDQMLDDVISGKLKVSSLDVKQASKDDVFTYIKVNDFNFYNDLADMTNSKVKKVRINSGDVSREVKKRMEEKIVLDKDVGALALIYEFSDKTVISLRSYGYNALDGESYIPGHVFTDSLAKKIVDKFIELGLGDGGGHENASALRLNPGVNLESEALPLIKKIIKEETEGKDLRKVPSHLKAKVERLMAGKNHSSVA